MRYVQRRNRFRHCAKKMQCLMDLQDLRNDEARCRFALVSKC